MATTNSLHHHHTHSSSSSHHHRHNLHYHQSTSLSLKHSTSFSSSSLSLTTSSSSSSSIISSSTTTNTTTTTSTTKFTTLSTHLTNQDFRKADEETRRLLIQLAGESAVNRGYVFFSEVKSISIEDLQTIDNLWIQHSNGRFGYSVQRKIWLKSKKDFTRFFIKLQWMKLLETEVVQYNYKAFPDEFIWELNDQTPLGHLPLTNALRGTQLLKSVLNHPAFTVDGDDDEDEETEEGNRGGEKKTQSKDTRVFKTDYSF